MVLKIVKGLVRKNEKNFNTLKLWQKILHFFNFKKVDSKNIKTVDISWTNWEKILQLHKPKKTIHLPLNSSDSSCMTQWKKKYIN